MTKKEKVAEFDQGYNVIVTGRHVHVSDGMQDHAIERLSRLEKIGNKIIDIHVTMDIQKQSHRVDLIMKYGSTSIRSHAITSDMYLSIDRAIAKLERQLKRYKQKLQDHYEKAHPIFDIPERVISSYGDIRDINDEIEEENLKAHEEQYKLHKVVAQESRPLKILTEEEAVMKMDLSGDIVMIFRSEEDRHLKVIYRRDDGNYGIIEAQNESIKS